MHLANDSVGATRLWMKILERERVWVNRLWSVYWSAMVATPLIDGTTASSWWSVGIRVALLFAGMELIRHQAKQDRLRYRALYPNVTVA